MRGAQARFVSVKLGTVTGLQGSINVPFVGLPGDFHRGDWHETHVGLYSQPDMGLAVYSSPRFTPSDDSASGDRGLTDGDAP